MKLPRVFIIAVAVVCIMALWSVIFGLPSLPHAPAQNAVFTAQMPLPLDVKPIFVQSASYVPVQTLPTTPGSTFDLKGFLGAIGVAFVNTLLTLLFTFGGGALPAIVVGWLADQVIKRIPFLAPFRETIKQWLLNQIEQLKRQRATTVALYAGQQMRDALKAVSPTLSPDQAQAATDQLKQTRNATAVNQLVDNKTAANVTEAQNLIKGAVANLKAQGVNP